MLPETVKRSRAAFDRIRRCPGKPPAVFVRRVSCWSWRASSLVTRISRWRNAVSPWSGGVKPNPGVPIIATPSRKKRTPRTRVIGTTSFLLRVPNMVRENLHFPPETKAPTGHVEGRNEWFSRSGYQTRRSQARPGRDPPRVSCFPLGSGRETCAAPIRFSCDRGQDVEPFPRSRLQTGHICTFCNKGIRLSLSEAGTLGLLANGGVVYAWREPLFQAAGGV